VKSAGRRAPSRVTFDTVRQLALALPAVVEGTCYGTPAFYVRKKFLARLREDNETLAVNKVEDIEREVLMASDPRTFFMTDHYVGYPMVLVRFATARPDDLRMLLERSWRRLAPKRLLAAYDSGKLR
jgi:hypothetical protein